MMRRKRAWGVAPPVKLCTSSRLDTGACNTVTNAITTREGNALICALDANLLPLPRRFHRSSTDNASATRTALAARAPIFVKTRYGNEISLRLQDISLTLIHVFAHLPQSGNLAPTEGSLACSDSAECYCFLSDRRSPSYQGCLRVEGTLSPTTSSPISTAPTTPMPSYEPTTEFPSPSVSQSFWPRSLRFASHSSCSHSLRVNPRPKVPHPIQRPCQRRCQRRCQRCCQRRCHRRCQRRCLLLHLPRLCQRRCQRHPLRRCQLHPLRRYQLHPLRLCQPLSVVQRVLTGRPETFQHSIVSATCNARGGNSSRPSLVLVEPCSTGLSKSAIGNGRWHPVPVLLHHPNLMIHPLPQPPFRLHWPLLP